MAKFIPEGQRNFELNLPHKDRWDMMDRLVRKYPNSTVSDSLKLMVVDPEFSGEFCAKSVIRERNATLEHMRARIQFRRALKELMASDGEVDDDQLD